MHVFVIVGTTSAIFVCSWAKGAPGGGQPALNLETRHTSSPAADSFLQRAGSVDVIDGDRESKTREIAWMKKDIEEFKTFLDDIKKAGWSESSKLFGKWGELSNDGRYIPALRISDRVHYGSTYHQIVADTHQKWLEGVEVFAEEANMKKIKDSAREALDILKALKESKTSSQSPQERRFVVLTLDTAEALRRLCPKFIEYRGKQLKDYEEKVAKLEGELAGSGPAAAPRSPPRPNTEHQVVPSHVKVENRMAGSERLTSPFSQSQQNPIQQTEGQQNEEGVTDHVQLQNGMPGSEQAPAPLPNTARQTEGQQNEMGVTDHVQFETGKAGSGHATAPLSPPRQDTAQQTEDQQNETVVTNGVQVKNGTAGPERPAAPLSPSQQIIMQQTRKQQNEMGETNHVQVENGPAGPGRPTSPLSPSQQIIMQQKREQQNETVLTNHEQVENGIHEQVENGMAGTEQATSQRAGPHHCIAALAVAILSLELRWKIA